MVDLLALVTTLHKHHSMLTYLYASMTTKFIASIIVCQFIDICGEIDK